MTENLAEWRDGEGRLHREDGPASITSDGRERWYLHGELHRVGGPALTYLDGRQEWRRYGLLHRDDGPAIYTPGWSDSEQWWLHGKQYKSEFEMRVVAAAGDDP